jgi:hypothetical protein
MVLAAETPLRANLGPNAYYVCLVAFPVRHLVSTAGTNSRGRTQQWTPRAFGPWNLEVGSRYMKWNTTLTSKNDFNDLGGGGGSRIGAE